MAKKKQKLFDDEIEVQMKMIGQLTDKELYLCGLALYWGEGGKTRYSELTFSNTDTRMIKFMLMWLKRCIHYPLERIRIHLHLYQDMDIKTEIEYWAKTTGLDKEQFTKPYIKATTLRGLTYKSRGHGTCNLLARGLQYARPALAGMEVIARMYD